MGKTAYAYFTKEHENGVKKANGVYNGFPIIPGKNEKRGKVRFPYTRTIFFDKSGINKSSLSRF